MVLNNTFQRRCEITDIVKNILITKLNLDLTLDEISNDTILFGSGLGLDSIDALQLVVGIESELNIKLPQSQFNILRSVNTIVDFILNTEEKPIVEKQKFQFNIQTLAIKEDYVSIRTDVGLSFKNDLIIYELSGSDIIKNLDKTLTGKIEFLSENSMMQTLLLNDDGSIKLYLEIMNFGEYYLLVTSKDKSKQLEDLFIDFNGEVLFKNVSQEYKIITIDGPNANQIIEKVFGPEVIGMIPNMIIQIEQEEKVINIIRVNATGEIGYLVIFCENSIEIMVQQLIKLAERGLHICNSEVYKILKLEAHIFDELTFVPNNESPLEAGVQWMIDFKKDNFIGKSSLLTQYKNGISKKLIPFYLSDIDFTIYKNEKILNDNGTEVGYLAVFTYSPALAAIIGLAYINSDLAWPNVVLKLESHLSNKIILTSTPFFITQSSLIN